MKYNELDKLANGKTSIFMDTINSAIQKQNLPISGVLKLRRILKNLEHESSVFNESKKSIIQKYAQKDEQGNVLNNEQKTEALFESEEQKVRCINDIITLLNTDIPVVVKLELQDLGIKDVNSTETSLFTASELLILESVINFNEESK